MLNPLSQNVSRRAFLAGGALAPLTLAACSNNNSKAEGSAGAASSSEAADGLTMLTASANYQKFSEALTKANPDVKLSMVSYAGYDTTDYIYTQMRAEDCPDVVINTFPNSDELQKNNLVDLSSKDFVNNVRMKLLDEVQVDGGIYLLPSNMSFFGPYYNKTLFEKHGWTVPNSLDELEQLVPKIKEAGVNVSEVTTTLPGSSFAFFWDILAPEFTSTLDGMDWMERFLAGEAKATGTLETPVATLQRWIDMGLFASVDPNMAQDSEAINRFKEGNTAFLITVSNQSFTQNEDGSGDEYRIMPWLSKDGSNNIIVTNVSRYYGLNKKLEDDKDKLSKGYKLMEFLTTAEGQEALLVNTNMVSPLKNAALDESDPLHDAAAMVDEGKSMPMVYGGWESYVTEIGNAVLNVLKGEGKASDLVAKFDEIQASVESEGGLEQYASVDEELDQKQVAQLVGAAFAQAADADCALVSIGAFHDFGKENKYGVNGKLYADIPVDANVVCTVNPLGWKQLIKTGKLTGEAINKWVKEGFLVDGDTEPFEYVLVKPEGTKLEDSKTYTVALADESEERKTECGMTETELVGQDTLIDYVTKLKTLNSKNIAWK